MNKMSLSRFPTLRRPAAALLAAGLTAAGIAGVQFPAAALGSCATSSPAGNPYSVTMCITAPDSDATVTGGTAVTSTVSVTGTNPGVRELVFTLNGASLLWDFQSPFTWTLDSTRWVDDSYTLGVYAIMRDGFNASQVAETLTFSNGIT